MNTSSVHPQQTRQYIINNNNDNNNNDNNDNDLLAIPNFISYLAY
jgi:hypothetical protein